MLGYRDSGMPNTSANQHHEAFALADPVEAAGRLVQIIRALRPLVMVTEPLGGGYNHPDHVKCHHVSVDAFHAAGDARAYPAAGPPWQVAKLYAVIQIDDGRWEALAPEFKAAGFDLRPRRRHRDRAPGPETATVALDVRPYSEVQRQALLAHRTQVPPHSFWVRLPEDLRRRAFATAYFQRLHPPTTPGETEPDLFDGLGVQVDMG
jgi:mycothiol S-conjugate amidase